MAQTLDAIYSHGIMGPQIDFIPNAGNGYASGVEGGQIITIGGTGLHRKIGVTNRPSAADVQCAVHGGNLGIFKVKKKAAAVFAIGDRVGWDFGLRQAVISTDGTIDVHLGTCVSLGQTGTPGALSTDDWVLVQINDHSSEEPTSG